MKSDKKVKSMVIALVMLTAVLVMGIVQEMHGNRVEIMDLTGNIVPYGATSYGDKYVVDLIFDSLLRPNKFRFVPGIAKSYTEEDGVIMVTLGSNNFYTPNGRVKLDADYIVSYYKNYLLKQEGVTNPGILNLESITKVASNKISFKFKTQTYSNILALSLKIGLLDGDRWYGSLAKVEYGKGSVKVWNTEYVNISDNYTLNANMRIADIDTAYMAVNSSVRTEEIQDHSYGLLYWTSASKVNDAAKDSIMTSLERNKARESLVMHTDSPYRGTGLYKSANYNLNQIDIELINFYKTIKIGVVDSGNLGNVPEVIKQQFDRLGLLNEVDIIDMDTAMDSNEYDLIYVRLSREMMGFISNLFTDGNILEHYRDSIESELIAINNSLTWMEMCSATSNLEVKLRSLKYIIFLDREYHVRAIRK